MNWMPIETAPKDGSRILLGKLEEGQWYWIVSGEFMNDGRFWCDWEDDDDYDLVFYRSPTHWCGLPINPISPHPIVTQPETNLPISGLGGYDQVLRDEFEDGKK